MIVEGEKGLKREIAKSIDRDEPSTGRTNESFGVVGYWELGSQGSSRG